MSDSRYVRTSSSLAAREQASREIYNRLYESPGNNNNNGNNSNNGNNQNSSNSRYSQSPFAIRYQRGNDNNTNNHNNNYNNNNSIKTVDNQRSNHVYNRELETVRTNSIFQNIVSLPLNTSNMNTSHVNNNAPTYHNLTVEVPISKSTNLNNTTTASPSNRLAITLPKPSHPSIVSTSPKNAHSPSPRVRVTPNNSNNSNNNRMFPKYNITKPVDIIGNSNNTNNQNHTNIAQTSPYKSALKNSTSTDTKNNTENNLYNNTTKSNSFSNYVVSHVTSLFGMSRNPASTSNDATTTSLKPDAAVYSNSPHLQHVKTGTGRVRKCISNNNVHHDHSSTSHTVAYKPKKREIHWDECLLRVAQIPTIDNSINMSTTSTEKRPQQIQKVQTKNNHLNTSTTSTSTVSHLPVILDTTGYDQVQEGELVLEQGQLHYKYAPALLHLEEGDEMSGGLYGVPEDSDTQLHEPIDIRSYLGKKKRHRDDIVTKQALLVTNAASNVPLQMLIYASPIYLRSSQGREEDGEILGVETIYDLGMYPWFQLARRMVAVAESRMDLRAMDEASANQMKEEMSRLYKEVDESLRYTAMIDLVEKDVTTLANLPGRTAGLLERELGQYTIRQLGEDVLFCDAYKLVQEQKEMKLVEQSKSKEKKEDLDHTQGNTPKKQRRKV